MIPFDKLCPDCARDERLVLHVQEENLPLPPGEYLFSEFYCEDPACDCRRALFQVVSPQYPGRILATINYGWESQAFYKAWMHGDAKAGREITSASLDPLNPQSELADDLLNAFRDNVRCNPSCPQQLRRHYEMFKSAQTTAPAQPATPYIVPHLTPGEILSRLQHVPEQCDFAPYEAALLAAVHQREAITPELIAALERVTADPAYFQKHQDDCLHSFAIYLLAQFREQRALDAFIRFFSLPGEQALDLTGDVVTENGAAILASVCGGDPAPLLRLANDEAANEFVRSQAIAGLLVQSVWGERTREAVIADLRGLFSTLAKPGNGYVWAELVCVVCDFNALELLPEVHRAFAEGLVDEDIIGLRDVDAEMREHVEPPWPSPAERYQWFCERQGPIDAVAECSGWLCFHGYAEEADGWDGLEEGDGSPKEIIDTTFGPPRYEPPPAAIPYVAPPKVGRNERCPCGSGKKYKKCCGK